MITIDLTQPTARIFVQVGYLVADTDALTLQVTGLYNNVVQAIPLGPDLSTLKPRINEYELATDLFGPFGEGFATYQVKSDTEAIGYILDSGYMHLKGTDDGPAPVQFPDSPGSNDMVVFDNL